MQQKRKHASAKAQQASEASVACLAGVYKSYIYVSKMQNTLRTSVSKGLYAVLNSEGVPLEDVEQLREMWCRVSQGRSRFCQLSHSSRGCCCQDVAQRTQRMCQGHIVIVLLRYAHCLIQR